MQASFTRRGFLRLAGSGLAVAAVPAVVLVEPEPVRRYWQVGADLSRGRSDTEDLLALADRLAIGGRVDRFRAALQGAPQPDPLELDAERHRLGWQQYGYPDDGPHDDMPAALRYSRRDEPDYIPPRGVQWQLLGVDEASLFGIEASEYGPWVGTRYDATNLSEDALRRVQLLGVDGQLGDMGPSEWVGDSDVQTILHRIGSSQLRRIPESES